MNDKSPNTPGTERSRAKRFAFARNESGSIPFEKFAKSLPAPAHRRALARRLDTFLALIFHTRRQAGFF